MKLGNVVLLKIRFREMQDRYSGDDNVNGSCYVVKLHLGD